MKDCVFCKIINKEIASEIVYEDNYTIIFKDLNPKAPVHLLAVPKKHIDSVMDIKNLSAEEFLAIFKAIADTAKELNLDADGFRIVTNTGLAAGQSVNHLHFHVLGKRIFSWPPG